jgi:hypothetical protein
MQMATRNLKTELTLVWGDPPAAARGEAESVLRPVLAQLRERMGTWALIQVSTKRSAVDSNRTRIKGGIKSVDGKFDAVTRKTEDGKYGLWVRAI